MLGDFPFSIPLLSLFLCLWFFFPFLLSFRAYNSSFSLILCPLLFLVSLSLSVVSQSVQGGFPLPDKGSIYHICALVCHLVSRHRQIHSQTDRATTCSSIHFCPSAWRLRCTTCQPAVFLRGEKSK